MTDEMKITADFENDGGSIAIELNSEEILKIAEVCSQAVLRKMNEGMESLRRQSQATAEGSEIAQVLG